MLLNYKTFDIILGVMGVYIWIIVKCDNYLSSKIGHPMKMLIKGSHQPFLRFDNFVQYFSQINFQYRMS